MKPETDYAEKINEISKQFLCVYPLNNFNWQNIFNIFLLEDVQELLLNKTVNSELVLKYPIQIKYQKLFLKYILDKLESLQAASEIDLEESTIHDDLYSAYGRLVAAGDSVEKNYKHYSLGKEYKVITLKESNSLISDGTTGLRTWQASLALSEWIIQNSNSFKQQTVLELGSGVGLTGLVLNNVCQTKTIYLTDCHEAVLKTLCENVKLNVNGSHLDTTDDIESHNDCSGLKNCCIYSNTDPSTISILNLPWENITPSICKDLGVIEKVIAADIIYDNDLFQSLINAMKGLKEYCGVEEFIFACTERNSETLEEFLMLTKTVCPRIVELPVPLQSKFLWPTDTPVKIFQFKD
uniref:Protein-lysine N-methyltransferase EEF2KMT-like n=1 Tax=Diabrotica virgifera virgifera TaxID=50390 RepID=A0A6P7G9R3_DIAVI